MIPVLIFVAGVLVGLGGPHLLVWVLHKLDPEGFARAQEIGKAEYMQELRDGKHDL